MIKLITADLHLESSPLTEYRWGIFNFLKEEAEKYADVELFILGDITQNKDKHNSELVNRITTNIIELSTYFNNIYILKGNHDFINEDLPYFKFLSNISKKIFFIKEVESFVSDIGSKPLYTFIPNTNKFSSLDFSNLNTKYLFLHQKFIGATSESGFIVQDGDKLELLKDIETQIFAGDIHKPQIIGNLEYVGSPYPVRFGDNYQGHIIKIDDKEKKSYIDFPTIKRASINVDSNNYKEKLSILKANDQCKVKVNLDKSEFYLWDDIKKNIKNICTNSGSILVEIKMIPNKDTSVRQLKEEKVKHNESNTEIINRFTTKEKLSDLFKEYAESISVGIK
jgi:hypothetical protein